MASKKTKLLVLPILMALAGIVLYVDETAVSSQLSNSNMARILGKGCRTYPTGRDCSGDGGSGCGSSCISCSNYTIGGSPGMYCDYKGSANDRTCDYDTLITCLTTMVCDTDAQDNEKCISGSGDCETEEGKNCPQCGYVTSVETKEPLYHCE